MVCLPTMLVSSLDLGVDVFDPLSVRVFFWRGTAIFQDVGKLGWPSNTPAIEFPVSPPHLFTFGYEGLDIVAFVTRLHEAQVRMIVDVRELPLSRKKGFSKTAFREHLAAAAIGYVHTPALGCPKEIRNQYRSDGDWARYTREFLAHLQTQDASVRELAQQARATTACLLCFEADYTMCHRTYVARAAKRFGAPVIKHLTAKTAFLDQPLQAAA